MHNTIAPTTIRIVHFLAAFPTFAISMRREDIFDSRGRQDKVCTLIFVRYGRPHAQDIIRLFLDVMKKFPELRYSIRWTHVNALQFTFDSSVRRWRAARCRQIDSSLMVGPTPSLRDLLPA